MKITKAECLEFLGEYGEMTPRMQRIYHLYIVVRWLDNKWPSTASALKAGIKKVTAKGDKAYALNGFTRREFGRMVWAKNEIKRREKVRADMMPKHII